MDGYNFTERVRKVLAQARQTASELGHPYVAPEHMLLAIVTEGNSVAATVIRNLEVDTDALVRQAKELAEPGRSVPIRGLDLPFTSPAKKVLELAMSEARELNHTYVGTEHLLLGLLREEKAAAARALTQAGVSLDVARRETLRVLGAQTSDKEWAGQHGLWVDGPAGRRIDRVEISLRFQDGEVRQRSFATPREAAEYLWRGGVQH